MSGKAIDAVPPARTAIWEVTLFVKESEGHSLFCGLFVTEGRCICRAKAKKARDCDHSAV
jgi:hypothetical protein